MSGRGEYLEFHRGEPAEAVLSSAAVVGGLDPGHDRQPELCAGVPAAAVEDILLQQAEERLHRGVVRARPHSSHRPAELRFPENPLVGV